MSSLFDDGWAPPEEETTAEGGTAEGEARTIRGGPESWHREASDEACRYIADLPMVFLDRQRSLLWIDDAPDCAPSIRYVVPATVPDLLGRAGVSFMSRAKEGWRWTSPPQVLCQTVVSRRPSGVPWRRFDGFASGPYLLGDGQIVNAQGYHQDGRLWLPHSGACELKETGKGSVRARGFGDVEDGRAALGWVMKELAEFPWADPDLDAAVWLGYLLTLITRPAYDHAPLFLFEASRPRSGKDLLFKCAETVAHGRAAHRITLADNPEENEKRIATGLLAGHTTLIFGDVKHLGSPLLLSLITEGHNVVIRLLGSNTTIPVPRTLTLGANANNVTFNVPDLIPRTIALRLDPPTETPESTPHSLDQDELLRHFAKHRAPMLAACFNALRGYLHRKRDPETEPRGAPCGSFPSWARLVRDCLLWYGYPDLVASQDRLRKQVPVGEQGAIDALYHAWWAIFRDQEVTTGRIIQAAANVEQTVERDDGGYASAPDPRRMALADALAGLFDQRPSPRKLTSILRGQRDRIVTLIDARVKLRQRTVHGQDSFRLDPIR